MTLKKIYFGTLGLSPDKFTGGLAQVTTNPQNTLIDYSTIQPNSKKDRPSAYFPKKTNSYAVAILGNETYELTAAERLIRAFRYAKYLGIPIAVFTTAQISQGFVLGQIRLDQLQLNNLQRMSTRRELVDPVIVLSQLPDDSTNDGYVYNNDGEIYKKLRQLRPLEVPDAHAKLSAKLLDSSAKTLDLILNRPTYWNLRLFTNLLSEKIKQASALVQKDDIDSSDELTFINEEANSLDELFEEIFSNKIIGKFDQMAQAKIDSPQVISNLTTKFQEIYVDCLEEIETLATVELTNPEIKKFAQRFSHKYQEVLDFINQIVADYTEQLRKIPLYRPTDEDSVFEPHFSLTDHSQEINDFVDWYDNYEPTGKDDVSDANQVIKQTIYQFRADLVGAKPKIWRRFEISGERTMVDLAKIIMLLFNMEGSHLYALTNLIGDQERREESKKIAKKYHNFQSPEDVLNLLTEPSKSVFPQNVSYVMPCDDPSESNSYLTKTEPGETLLQDSGAKEKTLFRFEYDFGDDWQVNLRVETISKITYPGIAPTTVLKGKGDGIIEDIGGIDALMAYQNEMDLHDFDKDELNYALQNMGL